MLQICSNDKKETISLYLVSYPVILTDHMQLIFVYKMAGKRRKNSATPFLSVLLLDVYRTRKLTVFRNAVLIRLCRLNNGII